MTHDLELTAAELIAEHSGNTEFLNREATNAEAQAVHDATGADGVRSDGDDDGGRRTVEQPPVRAVSHLLEARGLTVEQTTSTARDTKTSSARTDTRNKWRLPRAGHKYADIPFRHLLGALREADAIKKERGR